MARKRRSKSAKVAVKPGTAPDTNIIDSKLWQKNIDAKLPPAKSHALDRIIIAGMRIMFSAQTHQMMLQELQAPGAISDKLAQGITKLILLMLKESNGTMPPDLFIPAGTILLAKAAEFLNQSGTPVSEDDFRQAIVKLTALIKKVATPAPGQPGANPLGAAPVAPTAPVPAPSNPLQGA